MQTKGLQKDLALCANALQRKEFVLAGWDLPIPTSPNLNLRLILEQGSSQTVIKSAAAFPAS